MAEKDNRKEMCANISRRKVTEEIQMVNTWKFSSAVCGTREYLSWPLSEQAGKAPITAAPIQKTSEKNFSGKEM